MNGFSIKFHEKMASAIVKNTESASANEKLYSCIL